MRPRSVLCERLVHGEGQYKGATPGTSAEKSVSPEQGWAHLLLVVRGRERLRHGKLVWLGGEGSGQSHGWEAELGPG